MTELGLVGPGILGRTIALSLPAELCGIGPVMSHSKVSSRRAIREMKRGEVVTTWAQFKHVQSILVAVPQRCLAPVLDAALDLGPALKGKRLLITGVATQRVLASLERLGAEGAHVGGFLPIALYRRPSIVARGTTFATWGPPAAQRAARDLARALNGHCTAITPAGGAQALLAVAIVSGSVTTSLELAVRRLMYAGFPRMRAIEALAPMTGSCLMEHLRSRQSPPLPRMPSDCNELMRATEAAEPVEAALCQAALRFAAEDLR